MAFGIERESAEAWAGEDEPAVCEIWPEHLETVLLFCSLGSTWRRDPVGGQLTGMDYAQVAAVLWIRRVKPAERAQVFEGLQAMEREVLEAVSERGN